MIILISLAVLAIIFLILHFTNVVINDEGYAVIAGVAIFFLAFLAGIATYNQTIGSELFRTRYENHITYVSSISNQNISDSERQDELTSIWDINRTILNSRAMKNNLIVGIFFKNVGDLETINYNSIPSSDPQKTFKIHQE